MQLKESREPAYGNYYVFRDGTTYVFNGSTWMDLNLFHRIRRIELILTASVKLECSCGWFDIFTYEQLMWWCRDRVGRDVNLALARVCHIHFKET